MIEFFILFFGIILLGVLVWFIVGIVVFNRTFKRRDEESFYTRNLNGTKYAPYVKELREHIGYVESLNYSNESITSFDGLKLVGKYYNNRNSKKTVIMVHGYHAYPFNNFNISLRSFLDNGYNVLVITQRGHGESEGKYIAFGTLEYKDVISWTNMINDKYQPYHIVLYGVSMGCATVANCSDKDLPKNVKALVLDCGFSNTKKEIGYILKTKKHVEANMYMGILTLYAKMFVHTNLKMNPCDALSKTTIPCFFFTWQS